MPTPRGPAAPTTPRLLATANLRIVLVALVALILITAIQFEAPNALVRHLERVDYHVFVEVGRLARAGEIGLAYDADRFRAHQAALPGDGAFMPWTYPPQFDLLAWLLSLLPVGLGYAAFVLAGAGGLWLTLRRLDPDRAPMALLLVLPAVALTLRSGQNGLLTALLGALVCLFLLRRAPVRAGASLALLAYKPHLGLGLGAVALLRGGPRTILSGMACLLALLGLATWVLGPGIWPAFWASVHDSGDLLSGGAYQLEAMTSVFALLRRFGLSAPLAMAAQAALAIALLLAIGETVRRGWQTAHVLAFGGLAGLAMSPYVYGYDLVAAAPPLLLALPAVERAGRPRERRLLTAAILGASGWTLAVAVLKGPLGVPGTALPSLGGGFYLVALALTFRLLARDARQHPG